MATPCWLSIVKKFLDYASSVQRVMCQYSPYKSVRPCVYYCVIHIVFSYSLPNIRCFLRKFNKLVVK